MKILFTIMAAGIVSTIGSADTFYGSGDAAIPDGGSSGTAWTFDVTSEGLVTDARVFVQVNHPWVGDLRLQLQAPDGVSVTLMDRPGMPEGGWIGPWGCGGDDISGMFTDAADVTAEAMCSTTEVPVLHGNMLPAEPLSVLDGHPAQGTWTLTVFDDSPVDAGTVQLLSVILETAPDCNGNGVPDGDDIADGSSPDANGNGIPDECECPGDLNGNGQVDVDDMLQVLGDFGQAGGPGDLDGSGEVDVADILIVIGNWGSC
ncbi:MAG: proprotein convertase P-domain-containing protein [Phycisphaerales bacterium]|nr:proprotein convertase P-domain-containing protein [Phycisphaerales bacterium]